MPTILQEIEQWYHAKSPKRLFDNDSTVEFFHSFHPRNIFIKTLPHGACCLDMGAGDGSLSNYRKWPKPERPDIKVYAVSLDKGMHFNQYDGYEIGDFDQTHDFFNEMIFDAIFAAHFIEHIRSKDTFISWAKSKLKPGGQLYLEWPSSNAVASPTKTVLNKLGMKDIIIGNYFDDSTHLNYPDENEILQAMAKSGFSTGALGCGIVHMPVFTNELLACYKTSGDRVVLQFAYWLFTGWCRYVTAFALGGN